MQSSENYIVIEAKKAIKTVLSDMPELNWEFIERDGKRGPDYKLKIKTGNQRYLLLVEIKSSGEPRAIAELSGRANIWKNRYPGYPVLITPFISTRGREMCKSLNIGFIDFLGNAYLKLNGILIEKWGRETEKKEKRMQKSLFTTKSTWIIRSLLSKPSQTWKFDTLAEESGVSLGQAYKVVDKLEAEGFVEKKRGAISLVNGSELLDAWAETYRFDMQTFTGYYCPLKEQEQMLRKLAELPGEAYALTLGSGVSLIAPFVRSTDVYVYTTDPQAVVAALNLKPVEFGGNVYLVTPSDDGVLYDKQRTGGLTVVSNIQLYLDLYNYPMRGREQAEHLREHVMEV